MNHSSFHQLAAVTLLCCSACEIEIPNNVFRCSDNLDCPSGWVCDDERCREAGPGRGNTNDPITPEAGRGGRGGAEAVVAGAAAPMNPEAGRPSPAPPCKEKAPGSRVCDGSDIAVCSEDLLTLESVETCSGHSHCVEADEGVSCACDDGYARDQGGMCQNTDDCPRGACSPGGRCIDGLNDYSCMCDKGYEGSGSRACTNKDDCKANPCGAFTSGCVDGLNSYSCTCMPGYTNTDPSTCSNVNECRDVNACSLSKDYPCRDADPFYYCEGQFLGTPMPDVTIGAARTVSYAADADTVFENVTMLRWQRELPAVYPKCTGNITAAGDSCKWAEAKVYCEELVLGGFTEWRLPHKVELESLLDLTRVGTANPPSLPELPKTPPLGFWSSSAYSLEADRYWYVHFGEGWSYHGSADFEPARVRCVR